MMQALQLHAVSKPVFVSRSNHEQVFAPVATVCQCCLLREPLSAVAILTE